jgi:hypothetical protein
MRVEVDSKWEWRRQYTTGCRRFQKESVAGGSLLVVMDLALGRRALRGSGNSTPDLRAKFALLWRYGALNPCDRKGLHHLENFEFGQLFLTRRRA